MTMPSAGVDHLYEDFLETTNYEWMVEQGGRGMNLALVKLSQPKGQRHTGYALDELYPFTIEKQGRYHHITIKNILAARDCLVFMDGLEQTGELAQEQATALLAVLLYLLNQEQKAR